MMKKIEECWELFSVPIVADIGCTEDDEKINKLQFCCQKTNTCINIYYLKKENIDLQTLSKVMKTILS